ncbi:uncharacterized protein PAC_07556 [Phialocephala subalpina]|uniref:Uncharacterized protein n=1 Tax=Phialocephala subalpina TaxID=576137 RepID=A0A1L7WY09_9HELO|nr:uncharacterized protein PAC_07556 [Phialocephala subalpina]
MAAMTLSRFALLLATIGFKVITALPATTAAQLYPEVIPGPGLPSLASLNLTSAQLYTMPSPISSISLLNRATSFQSVCGPQDAVYVNVQDIIACYHYLSSLNQNCGGTTFNQGDTMCTAGNAKVVDSCHSDSCSVRCTEAAVSVLWAINSCTRPDQSCAGWAQPSGNGDLIVGAINKNYNG